MKYSLATETWDDAEKNAAKSVIDSGICTMGTITKEFERKFADYVGSKYAVFVNSGSSANLLGITSMLYHSKGLKPGDEVIVPAVSWSTTYYPIHQAGLKLVFVDVSKVTFNIDPKKIEEAITPNTKAIFAVNLLGNPCNFDSLNKICKENDLLLFEDNCESLGATYDGKHCGTFGLFGTYSTFFSHHICTVEGGVVVTDDEELYHIMLSVRSHGWIRHLPDVNHVYNKSGNQFEDSFKFVLPGYNIRGNDIFAAIGLEQLKKVNSIIETRKDNAYFIFEHLDDHGYIEGKDGSRYLLQYGNYPGSSWFGFGFICFQDNRDEVVKKLMHYDIECRPIVAGNFCKNPVIKHMDHRISGDLVNSDIIDTHGFFIGNNGEDISDKIKYFLEIL